MGRVKKELRLTRYFTYLFISVWKIIAFFISSLVIFHLKGQNIGHFFTMFGSAFREQKITVTGVRQSVVGAIPDLSEILPTGDTETINSDLNSIVYVLLIQIVGSYFTYIVGKYLPKQCSTFI